MRRLRQIKHIVKNHYEWRRRVEGKSKPLALWLALVDAGDLTMYSLLYGRL